MGCGAVSDAQSPISSIHNQLSTRAILKLLPSMAVHAPFLTQKHFEHFSSTLRLTPAAYVLPLSPSVPSS
jgi:hypothetical protein